jgi:DNA-binding FadR family transcriptional regulator
MALARRPKRSEQVAAGIKQLIIDEQLRPGDRLPTEKEIAARFGVSRVSVREATKALSFLGIVRAAPRRGLSVGEVDMSRVTEYLGFQLALTDYPKAELWHTRFVIETGALAYVARAMAADTAVYDRLRGMVEVTRELTDPQERVQADVAFHQALIEASGIGPLVAFSDLLQIFFTRMRNPNPPATQWEKTVRQHEELIEHLRAGDVEAARGTLARHLDEYAEHLKEN